MVEAWPQYQFDYISFESLRDMSSCKNMIIQDVTLKPASSSSMKIGKALYFHGYALLSADKKAVFVNYKPQNIENLKCGDIVVYASKMALVRASYTEAMLEIYLRDYLVPFFAVFYRQDDAALFAKVMRGWGVKVV